MNQGTAHRHADRHAMNHAKLVTHCQAQLAAIEERRRLRVASQFPHEAPAPEEAPLQVPRAASVEPTEALSEVPPGPPDSPGESSPGTTLTWERRAIGREPYLFAEFPGRQYTITFTRNGPGDFDYFVHCNGVELPNGWHAELDSAKACAERHARLVPGR